ncbi:MAG: LolA-related protein [Betaproteobacteria bacterium]
MHRLLFALLLVPSLAFSAGEWTVAELMQGLAKRGPESARFAEKKYLAILDKPIESSGELRFVPPNRLEKRTKLPKPESLVLDRDVLTLERDKKIFTLQLRDYPQIAMIVESLRGMLGGDQHALEKNYRLEIHGNRERWTLVMLPSDTKLAELVLRIDVAGTRDRVRSIEIRQADGDRSVMTIDEQGG